MTAVIDADYLVVGAGAAGLAFADALVAHSDARVALVDRRGAPGGHWRSAYPFVRLHQASQFYGVASRMLGDGGLQKEGPESGLHSRATGAEVCDYYDGVLDSLVATGRVEFLGESEFDGERVRSLVTGEERAVRPGCRIVDAHHLSPAVPADTPPPFVASEGVTVMPIGRLPQVADAERFVIVGSGKTATDAIVWLLGRGTDPGDITWVRPRDPWMLNRAVVQPEPAIFQGMVADVMDAAATAGSIDRMFLDLEHAGVMIRIDAGVTPTMARTPTLGLWELDALRTVENVVRRGHLREAGRGVLRLDDGTVTVPADAVVVHCAADGLPLPALVPIWAPETITLQPVRSGFPCFGAALVGYVEATREGDAAKNALCPPSPYGNTLAEWARMTVLGARASAAFLADADIRAWADSVALNPAGVPEGYASAALDQARARISRAAPAGMAALARMAGLAAQ